MKRLSLTVSVDPLPFNEPLRIAGHVLDGSPAIRVMLDDGEAQGRGEASGVFYLGDNLDHMLAEVARWRPRIEAGIDRHMLRDEMPAGGARNAVDAALWELESHRAAMPVWRMAGLDPPRPLVTTYTLGAEEPVVIERHLRCFASARAIKLKLDGDFDADVERIRLVRKTRPDVWFMADANQGYTVDGLDRLLPVLDAARVAVIEQPVRRGDESALEGFRSHIPIAADESLQQLDDLAGLVGRFQVANIKLDKCGGLTEALLIEAEARRLGLKVMIGNMAGSSLSTAPAFLVGQRSDIADLDGPIFLQTDYAPAATFHEGTVFCDATMWGAGEAARP